MLDPPLTRPEGRPSLLCEPQLRDVIAKRSDMVLTVLTLAYLVIDHTSLVVVKRPTEIIIAADSKRTDPRVVGRSIPACKIVRTSSLVFAATGYSQDEATGFNVTELALQSSRATGDSSNKVQVFEQMATEQLAKAANWFQVNDPKVYALIFDKGDAFKIVFAALDRGTPVLYERAFKVTRGGDGKSKVSVWRRDYPDPRQPFAQSFTAYGETDGIQSFLQNQRDFWASHDPIAAARRLVEVEIAAKPDKVGQPVDIIRIDPNGIQWVAKKPACPEIQDG